MVTTTLTLVVGEHGREHGRPGGEDRPVGVQHFGRLVDGIVVWVLVMVALVHRLRMLLVGEFDCHIRLGAILQQFPVNIVGQKILKNR
jgi:hypothetical protein